MAEISLVFCGEAGQGIQTVEDALTHILKEAGFHIFSTKEYMSRIRGGSNTTEIRIADHPVAAFVNKIDILILLSSITFSHLGNRVSPDTLIVGPIPSTASTNKICTIEFDQIALKLGSKLYTNSVAVGFVLGLLKVEPKFYEEFFTQRYRDKSPDIINKNILAIQEGYKFANELLNKGDLVFNIKPTAIPDDTILLNGAEALAFGAIAGGCNFIAAYPMSPSTGVFTQLGTFSPEFDIIVEQAEDEIASINMALGAWYAGGRALVTTAGGGFALMCEGVSLAGMIETPVVISIGQRPGPATGLPTRTEQGDLNLALYAGHGEFPRIIFAPGTIEEAFYLMQKAFVLADKYQIPIIVLSDQLLVDSYYISKPLDPLPGAVKEQHIVNTTKDYKRYQLTDNGVSPRGIPGWGEGIVSVDSDEHTEEGYITENFNVRTSMVQKRLKKFELLQQEVIAPTFIGKENYKTLLVCWGSNYHVVKEALEVLQLPDIAGLHFSQVFPLSPDVIAYFNKADKVVVIENNATGQFAKLLKQQLNVKVDQTILKYNGLPFAVEEIVAAVNAN